jgi:hypothetical protein
VPLCGEAFFERFAKALEDGNSREELRPTLKDLRYHQTLDYALMLLRYYGPGFDERWSSKSAPICTGRQAASSAQSRLCDLARSVLLTSALRRSEKFALPSGCKMPCPWTLDHLGG